MTTTEVTEPIESGPPSEPDPTPSADPASAVAPGAQAETKTDTVSESPEAAEPVPAPRRRGGRTVALLGVAAVLGIVAGTAVGYGVQAQRPPTALPALNQPSLAYPAKPLPKGKEPKPLTAAEDRGLKTEGDLRDLLLPKPKGAKKAPFFVKDGRLSIASYAGNYRNPGGALTYLLEDDIRRVVATTWSNGKGKITEINLIQFRSGSGEPAAAHAEDQRSYQGAESGSEVGLIKGSPEGRTYLLPVDREAGFLDYYTAYAVFHRGDVMVEIFVSDTKKVGQKEIASLAERQLERL
ncbi:hypothetical protein ACGFRB_00250 [Streptomyces sp. NPDC048718]|uniref:hypothetical protein n=1 Tax=Streptomyces sp. NPDC048718 TaxID=3365587 RepID=UPI003717EA08